MATVKEITMPTRKRTMPQTPAKRATSTRGALGKKLRKKLIVSPYQPFSTQVASYKNVNLKYVEILAYEPPAAGNYQRYVFRANSVYDPDKTGTGHQPLGYQQNADLYDKYVVNGAKFTVNACYQQWEQGSTPLYVGCGYINGGTVWPSARNAIENGADIKCMPQFRGYELKTVATYSAPTVYACTSDQLRLKGDVIAKTNTNPVAVDDFVFYQYHPSLNLPAVGTLVRIEIDYNVTFFEPKRDIPEDP